MADKKSKQPSSNERRKSDKASEGQYGGLKGLGPGGGRDIVDATDTDDIDPKDVELKKD